VDWLGTLRGRIGYLVTPALLGYATGGLAYGGASLRTTSYSIWSGNILGPLLRSSGSTGELSNVRIGWTVGGGAEWAFAPNLSAKAEYLLYDLGEARFAASPLATDLFGAFFNAELPTYQARFRGHVARAGVNYHFDLFQPSPLKMKY
jgi:outer membrane immunogenic protein